MKAKSKHIFEVYSLTRDNFPAYNEENFKCKDIGNGKIGICFNRFVKHNKTNKITLVEHKKPEKDYILLNHDTRYELTGYAIITLAGFIQYFKDKKELLEKYSLVN